MRQGNSDSSSLWIARSALPSPSTSSMSTMRPVSHSTSEMRKSASFTVRARGSAVSGNGTPTGTMESRAIGNIGIDGGGPTE